VSASVLGGGSPPAPPIFLNTVKGDFCSSSFLGMSLAAVAVFLKAPPKGLALVSSLLVDVSRADDELVLVVCFKFFAQGVVPSVDSGSCG